MLVRDGQTHSKSKLPTLIDVKPQGGFLSVFRYCVVLHVGCFSDPNVPSDDFIFVVDGKEYPALVFFLICLQLLLHQLTLILFLLVVEPADAAGKSQNFR